jgi:hypothetical protein
MFVFAQECGIYGPSEWLSTFAGQINFKHEEFGGSYVGFVSGLGSPPGIPKGRNRGQIWTCCRPQVDSSGSTWLAGPDVKICAQSVGLLAENAVKLLRKFKATFTALDAKLFDPPKPATGRACSLCSPKLTAAMDVSSALHRAMWADNSSANCPKMEYTAAQQLASAQPATGFSKLPKNGIYCSSTTCFSTACDWIQEDLHVVTLFPVSLQ